MRRSVLLTLAVLGAAVSLVGGVGLFAALSDSALTGQNSAESGALGASADIRLATASVDATGQIQCAVFVEHLMTGFFSVTGIVEPGEGPPVYFCLKNVGSQSVSVSLEAFEYTDVEVACTGDEALNGDTTCNPGEAGELGPVLRSSVDKWVMCDSTVHGGTNENTLFELTTTTVPLLSLSPNEQACLSARLGYPSTTPTAARQIAQSDRVTWKYHFIATAGP